MPNYEYLCPNCGRRCERMRPIASRRDPVSCEDCDAAMELAVTSPAKVRAPILRVGRTRRKPREL